MSVLNTFPKITIFNRDLNDPKCVCNNCHVEFPIDKDYAEKILHGKAKRYFCSNNCCQAYSRKNNKVKTNCNYCGKLIERRKDMIKNSKESFCNTSCSAYYYNPLRDNKIDVECSTCGNPLKRTPWYIKTNKNHFCNKNCAAIHRNKNKTWSNRRSKLEIWLEEQLKVLYPKLEIEYNFSSDDITELDIYIPSLKIAFEINGIFHYEPIYGEDNLERVKKRDNKKISACLKRGIKVISIDSSKQKYFKESTSIDFLNIIKDNIGSDYKEIHS
jgi:hypothetical protein